MLKSLHAFCQGDGISGKILRFLYSFARNNNCIAEKRLTLTFLQNFSTRGTPNGVPKIRAT